MLIRSVMFLVLSGLCLTSWASCNVFMVKFLDGYKERAWCDPSYNVPVNFSIEQSKGEITVTSNQPAHRKPIVTGHNGFFSENGFTSNYYDDMHYTLKKGDQQIVSQPVPFWRFGMVFQKAVQPKNVNLNLNGLAIGYSQITTEGTYKVCFHSSGYRGDASSHVGYYTRDATTASNYRYTGDIFEIPSNYTSTPRCKSFTVALDKPVLSIKDPATENNFTVEWQNDSQSRQQLYRKFESGNWELIHEDVRFSKDPIAKSFGQSSLAAGDYEYKVVSILGGIEETSSIVERHVEYAPPTPSGFNLSALTTSSHQELSWSKVEFPDVSTVREYKVEYQKRKIGEGSYVWQDPITVEEDSLSNGKVSHKPFIFENGMEYKFWISACNLHCSVAGGKDGYYTKAVFPPSEGLFSVVPSHPISSDGVIEPLSGPSNNGEFALSITSPNAMQIEIREWKILKTTELKNPDETSYIPVSVDPALIIPVTTYDKEEVVTYNCDNSPYLVDPKSICPSIGSGSVPEPIVHEIINKGTKVEDQSVFKNFTNSDSSSPYASKNVSGRYIYKVTVCDQLWDFEFPEVPAGSQPVTTNPNQGLKKSDHCVESALYEVDVDLQIQQPTVAFDGDGNLQVSFPDTNPSEATAFKIFDKNDRLVGSYATVAEAQAAMRSLSGALYGHQLIACNASVCTEPVIIDVPPLAPSYLAVTGSATGGDFTVSWAKSDGAIDYKLEYEVYDLDDPTKRLYPESGGAEVIETSSNKWSVASDNVKYGRYQFTVRARNNVTTSPSKGPAVWDVEIDPTLYIRKQLYTAWEQDDCTATGARDCLQLGDDVTSDSPEDGEYARSLAAFRYLDEIYAKGISTNVIYNHAASANELSGNPALVIDSLYADADSQGTVLYGDAQRLKALKAEEFAKALLSEFPTNSSVRQLILDIYYDRAVAEMLIADSLRTDARVMRFVEEGGSYQLQEEADLHNQASKIYELALFGDEEALNANKLPGYSNLISPSNSVYNGILTDYAEFRAQVSPRYWEGEQVSRLVRPESDDENGLLLNGYKDLVLIYQLMTDLLESKSEALKLTIMSGQENATVIEVLDSELRELRAKTHEIHLTLIGNRSECLNYVRYYKFNVGGLPGYKEEDLKYLCLSDNYPNEFPYVQGLFGADLASIQGNQWNGFLSAKADYLKADANIDAIRKWMDGDVNMIGLPNDILFKKDLKTEDSSFGEYVKEIQADGSSYRKLTETFKKAREDYAAYRSNSDRAATEYHQRAAHWKAKLTSLIGYDCSATSCKENGDYSSSEISIQVKAIESAYKEQKFAEEQVAVFEGQLKLEIDQLIAIRKSNVQSEDIILNYGSQQINIQKRITKLKIDAAKKQRRLGAMTSISNASAAFASGFVTGGGGPGGVAVGAAMAGTSMANSFAEYQAAGVAINSTRSIGKLEQLSAELALEQQVKLERISNEQQELMLATSIESKWLEANSYLIQVERAAKNVELEYEKLAYLIDQAKYAANQIELASEETAQRYFADPIHARRVTNSMMDAEQEFEYVQQRLWFAANMLEYKLGVFKQSDDLEHSFDKRDLLKARTVEDLSNFLTSMINYNGQYGKDGKPQVRTISLKDHLLGYFSAKDLDAGDLIRKYPHPNPNYSDSESLLTGPEAFEEHVLYGWSLFIAGPNSVEYQTWKASSPYYFELDEYGVKLMVSINSNERIKDTISGGKDLFGRLAIGLNSGTKKLCYRDIGTYANFINQIGVNVAVSHRNEPKVRGKVKYAGASRASKRYVPDLHGQNDDFIIYQNQAGDSAQYIGEGDDQIQVLFNTDTAFHDLKAKIVSTNEYPYEFDANAYSYSDIQNYLAFKDRYYEILDYVEYPARDWFYDGTADLDSDTFIQASLDMSANVKVVETDSTNWSNDLYSNTKLRELSIFTSEWEIEIPLIAGEDMDISNVESAGAVLISPLRLQDVQLFIQYNKVDRNGNSEDCSVNN